MARSNESTEGPVAAAQDAVAAEGTDAKVKVYDAYGREYTPGSPVELTNLIYGGGGYSLTKPDKPLELPTEPVGNPGPLSGAVRS